VFPRDFEEAARIDGAARWQILWNVILPMARPAIAVLGLFSFIGLLEKSFLAVDRRQYTRNGNRSGRAQPF
jgi:ABC-type glycerol-3-phosphate transport system permease component